MSSQIKSTTSGAAARQAARTPAREAASAQARATARGEAALARAAWLPAPAAMPRAATGSPLAARSMLQWQRQYGNRSLLRTLEAPQASDARHVVQRRTAADAPANASAGASLPPTRAPRFNAAVSKVRQAAEQEKKHSNPATRAAATQASAAAPANDLASQAKAAQVGKMNEQQPGAFDRAKFIADVKKAIAAAAPANIDEAEKYETSGKAKQGREQMGGLVRASQEAAGRTIESAATEAPDASRATPKAVAPAPQEAAGAPSAPIDAASAMPAPKPAAELDLRHDQSATEARMQDARVTDAQLARSNEPQFRTALGARQAAGAHTAAAPAAYRASEQQLLGDAGARANAATSTGIAGMHTSRASALNKASNHQAAGKAADEAKRAKLAGELESIYATTKQDVTTILDGIENRIDPVFAAGEDAARAEMARAIAADTKAFHDKRGLLDEFIDIFTKPPELDAIVDRAVKRFLVRMDDVVGRVADIVAAELARAKARIATGQKELTQRVSTLPRDLKQIGQDLLAGFDDKFKSLSADVDARRNAIIEGVAQKYAAARDAANARAQEMKDANKGLWDKAKDAIGDTVDTILKLKAMLLGVLAKASAVIDKIIADPIAFLGNLVAAIKQGLHQFVGNIFTHLKSGLMGWLFGTLADAGIRIPERFDLKGILGLVLQLLGLTYENVRARAVGILGEKAVAAMEKTVDIFKTLASEGIAGIWKFIVDKLTTLKDTMLAQVQDFVVTKIVTAGVTWLVSMLNPASAFVRACKMIYDVVMFFVERGSQIMGLVNAVIDGAGAIASGAIGGAANLVEQSLAKALPVAISFLASLLGLGGIAEKIKSVIQAIQAPVNKAIDTVVNGAVNLFKKLGGDKLIAAAQKGIAWGKDKIEKGKAWVKSKASGAKEWAQSKFYGGTEADKQKRLEQGVKAGVNAINGVPEKTVPGKVAKAKLAGLRLKYRLPVLEALAQNGRWVVHGEIQRMSAPTNRWLEGMAPKKDDKPTKTLNVPQDQVPAMFGDLHEDVFYYFEDAKSVGKDGKDFKVGRLLKIVRFEPVRKGVIWWAEFLPRLKQKTWGSLFAPLTKSDNKTRAYSRARNDEGIETKLSKTKGDGGRAMWVRAKPLAFSGRYTAPGRASPVGWSRLADSADWVRAHLVNGEMGGPAARWNLVPTPQSINTEMCTKYENWLREELMEKKYFHFEATVDYHSDSASRDIGNASDFAKRITVKFGYTTRKEPDGDAFEDGPVIRSEPFDIPVPRPEELNPDCLRSGRKRG